MIDVKIDTNKGIIKLNCCGSVGELGTDCVALMQLIYSKIDDKRAKADFKRGIVKCIKDDVVMVDDLQETCDKMADTHNEGLRDLLDSLGISTHGKKEQTLDEFMKEFEKKYGGK